MRREIWYDGQDGGGGGEGEGWVLKMKLCNDKKMSIHVKIVSCHPFC